jgi:hypothetical protein
MDKIIKYGDFFLSSYTKMRVRKMRAEIREIKVKEYIKRAEKGLPLFDEERESNT